MKEATGSLLENKSYKLVCDDCLTALKELPENSVDSICSNVEVQSFPFHKLMTRMTKSNQVVQVICVIWVLEGRYGLNVMHVVVSGFTKNTTTSACVLISLPCFSSQAFPLFSIISGVTAAPCGVVFSCSELITTIQRTERLSAFSFSSVRGVIESFAAVCANHPVVFSFPLWFSGRFQHSLFAFGGVRVRFGYGSFGYSHRSCFVLTVPGTERMFVFLDMSGRPFKSGIANRARKFYFFGCFLLCLFSSARVTACYISSVFEACLVGCVCFFTNRTGPFYFLSHFFSFVLRKWFLMFYEYEMGRGVSRGVIRG